MADADIGRYPKTAPHASRITQRLPSLVACPYTALTMTLEERLERHLSKTPDIHPSAYVAPQATVIGDVTLKAQSSVWPGAVLRGDINSIVIGEGSNVQDGSVVHLADDYGVEVGNYVTIGHLAMVHACQIGDECLIGMSSTVLDGAVIGPRCVVGAGALVTKGFVAPEGSVIMGVPGKIVKTLTPEEQADLRKWAEKYTVVARAHMKRLQSDITQPPFSI
ncbi:MAG: gamma carbonic anhydrase family protein [Puniceicoccales bacterium]